MWFHGEQLGWSDSKHLAPDVVVGNPSENPSENPSVNPANPRKTNASDDGHFCCCQTAKTARKRPENGTKSHSIRLQIAAHLPRNVFNKVLFSDFPRNYANRPGWTNSTNMLIRCKWDANDLHVGDDLLEKCTHGTALFVHIHFPTELIQVNCNSVNLTHTHTHTLTPSTQIQSTINQNGNTVFSFEPKNFS